MQTLIRLIVFVLTGLIFAAVGEYMFSVILRGDWSNFFGSIFFNSLYMLFVFLSSRLIFAFITRPLAALLVYYVLYGATGLAVEWYLIGNSPWGNPDASQWGMFAYWTSMSMMALIFSDPLPRPGLGRLRRIIAASFAAFAAFSIGLGYAIPDDGLRFAAMIWLVVLGYTLLTLFYFPYARMVARPEGGGG